MLALRKADESMDLQAVNTEGKTAMDVAIDPATRAELKRWNSSNRQDTSFYANLSLLHQSAQLVDISCEYRFSHPR